MVQHARYGYLKEDRKEDSASATSPMAVATSHDFIFIGSFGFPGWWDWGWGWGYPYEYYGGYNYGGYGSGYGYGDSSRSRVAELQTRLARAGYYHGSIDGVLGPQTRRAIRAYERDHDHAS